MHAPDGRAPQFIAPLIFPAKPGAPFMAIANTQSVRTLPDGSTVTLHSERVVARDLDGRVFEERRAFTPKGKESRVLALDYVDPYAKSLTRCFPGPNYCGIYDYHMPFPGLPGRLGLQPDGTTYITRENLGIDAFAGLEVQRSRDTTTLATETVGNSRTILRSCDYWYSSALGVNVQVKRHDPRDGDQTLWLSDLTLSAPAPDTFKLPQGFRMIDMRGTGAVPGLVVNQWRPPLQTSTPPQQ